MLILSVNLHSKKTVKKTIINQKGNATSERIELIMPC